MRAGRGPCAKREVRCVLVDRISGHDVVGENWCRNPQKVCPREEGEGYEKCKTICQQDNHAEEDALRQLNGDAYGYHAILYGHDYYCPSCQKALFAAGVQALRLGAEK